MMLALRGIKLQRAGSSHVLGAEATYMHPVPLTALQIRNYEQKGKIPSALFFIESEIIGTLVARRLCFGMRMRMRIPEMLFFRLPAILRFGQHMLLEPLNNADPAVLDSMSHYVGVGCISR